MRAMGTTSRFGLPESCDNRPAGGTAPAPPLRASTIRSNRPRINKFTIKARAMQGGAHGDINFSDPASLQKNSDQFGLSGVASYQKVTGKEAEDKGKMATDPYDSSDDD